MGVTLRLEGRREVSDPAAFVARAAAWLEALDHDPRPRVQVSEESPLLVAELHPGAEPIELALHEDGVSLRAKTSTAGPGYHRFVCDLADRLGAALAITWDELDGDGEPADDTGWRTTRDDAALEEVFLDWLGGAVAQIAEMAAAGMKGFALSLPAGHAFEHDGAIATPMGPRDRAWLDRVRDDPRAGVDAFSFWDDVGSAAYYRGLALTRMWTDVRWRPPLDDDERGLLDSVATWIEKAHGLDPKLPLPWLEQSELLTLLGEESLRATRAHMKTEVERDRPRVGYRRRPVRVTLSGGWHISVSGDFAERWDERGTWVAWDETRSVWFTSFTVMGDDGAPSPSTEETLSGLPPIDGDEVFEMERGDVRGYAAFAQEERDGTTYHRLEAHAAEREHAAVGTLVFTEPSDREWALATWGSLSR